MRESIGRRTSRDGGWVEVVGWGSTLALAPAIGLHAYRRWTRREEPAPHGPSWPDLLFLAGMFGQLAYGLAKRNQVHAATSSCLVLGRSAGLAATLWRRDQGPSPALSGTGPPRRETSATLSHGFELHESPGASALRSFNPMANDEKQEQRGRAEPDRPDHDPTVRDVRSPAIADPAPGVEVVKTNDEIITTEPCCRPEWRKHPDSTMVIETNRIREPESGSPPGVVIVPFEDDPLRESASGAARREDRNGRHDRGPDEDNRGHHGSDRDQDEDEVQARPSMTRMLLYAGLVALVCGMVGAWGYTYFFGASDSSKSGEQGSSSKQADSGKSSGSSSKGSDSGSGSKSTSDSGSGAMASSGKEIPGFTRANDADTLKKQFEHLSSRIDQLSQRIDQVSHPRNETPPDIHTLQNKVSDLSRTVESMGDLPARFRRLEDRLEDVRQQMKTLRSQLPPERGGNEAPSVESPRPLSDSRSSGAQAAIAPASLATSVSPSRVADTPDAALAQGMALFKDGKYAEAWTIFRKLELTRPGDARVWYYSALARGLTTHQWGRDTQILVEKGAERERAGLPSSIRIDDAFAGLTRAQGKDWLSAYRAQLVKGR